MKKSSPTNKKQKKDMSEFVSYQHVEKLGNTEVDGILFGDCYVFPKIDGTNAQVWYDGERIRCGSRNRELSLDNDNAGFMAWVMQNEELKDLCSAYQGYRFYGEWLVPHSLKTYKESSWRRFYIFDVVKDGKHVPYDEYKGIFKDFPEVDYICPIRIIKNPTEENVFKILEENNYLIEDGQGNGEGVVIKNYQFVNKYGRQTWAKIVTSEFKEKHRKEMGAPISKGSDFIEEKIVEDFVTTALVDKIVAKITLDEDGWSSSSIPRLLHTAFYDLVREHTWDYVKKYKNPKVDYKLLMRFTAIQVKKLKPEIF